MRKMIAGGGFVSQDRRMRYIERSLRRLADDDWMSNEEPAEFIPYQCGHRRI